MAVDLLTPAKVAAELEACEIDNAAELLERFGPPERIAGWIAHYHRERQQRKIGKGVLAGWIRGGSEPPVPKAAGPQVDRQRYDEERAWAERHLPDVAPAIAVSALEMSGYKLRREPTPDEVREHAMTNAARQFPEDPEQLVLRSSYSPADHDRWDAEAQALRARRPDLFRSRAPA